VPTPPWPLGLPTRLRPVGILGVGASSVVWQVRDTEVGADRAVKVVAAAPGSTVDPARRAETEARALARLAGLAGVVELHEVGRTQDGAAWLVYDLVSGGTLAALGPCSDEELVRVGVRLAVTLVGAHRLEVHHGDISPTNVLIDAEPPLRPAWWAGHAPDDPVADAGLRRTRAPARRTAECGTDEGLPRRRRRAPAPIRTQHPVVLLRAVAGRPTRRSDPRG
jgi:serine/threonine protein kinase